MPLTFPKSVRLQRSSEFLRVKTAGRAFSGRLMTVGALRDCGSARVGIITSRRVGGAVERNRVRRRLRELMRLTMPQWMAGVWVVVIARQSAVQASFEALRDEWLRLAVRAGILPRDLGQSAGTSHPEGGANV